jgi:hypothetical protein
MISIMNAEGKVIGRFDLSVEAAAALSLFLDELGKSHPISNLAEHYLVAFLEEVVPPSPVS